MRTTLITGAVLVVINLYGIMHFFHHWILWSMFFFFEITVALLAVIFALVFLQRIKSISKLSEIFN